MSDKIGAFVEELEQLMKKHGVAIVDGSCSCCGPTKLVDTTTEEELTTTDDWDDARFTSVLRR